MNVLGAVARHRRPLDLVLVSSSARCTRTRRRRTTPPTSPSRCRPRRHEPPLQLRGGQDRVRGRRAGLQPGGAAEPGGDRPAPQRVRPGHGLGPRHPPVRPAAPGHPAGRGFPDPGLRPGDTLVLLHRRLPSTGCWSPGRRARDRNVYHLGNPSQEYPVAILAQLMAAAAGWGISRWCRATCRRGPRRGVARTLRKLEALGWRPTCRLVDGSGADVGVVHGERTGGGVSARDRRLACERLRQPTSWTWCSTSARAPRRATCAASTIRAAPRDALPAAAAPLRRLHPRPAVGDRGPGRGVPARLPVQLRQQRRSCTATSRTSLTSSRSGRTIWWWTSARTTGRCWRSSRSGTAAGRSGSSRPTRATRSSRDGLVSTSSSSEFTGRAIRDATRPREARHRVERARPRRQPRRRHAGHPPPARRRRCAGGGEPQPAVGGGRPVGHRLPRAPQVLRPAQLRQGARAARPATPSGVQGDPHPRRVVPDRSRRSKTPRRGFYAIHEYDFRRLREPARTTRAALRDAVGRYDGEAVGIGATARATTVINYCGFDAEDILLGGGAAGVGQDRPLHPGHQDPRRVDEDGCGRGAAGGGAVLVAHRRHDRPEAAADRATRATSSCRCRRCSHDDMVDVA